MIGEPHGDKPEYEVSIIPVPRVLVQNRQSDENENDNTGLHVRRAC